jgi:hypothetical protein
MRRLDELAMEAARELQAEKQSDIAPAASVSCWGVFV